MSPGYVKAETLENFYETPEEFSSFPRIRTIFQQNHMAFDLGFDHLDRQSVNASIEKLDATFDLILVADYFTESMILLRKELCWNMDDVVFFSNNARSSKTPIELRSFALNKNV